MISSGEAPYKGLERDFNWCTTESDDKGQMTRWGLCDSDIGIPECTEEDSKNLGIILYFDFTNFFLLYSFFNILISRIFLINYLISKKKSRPKNLLK